MHAPLGVSHTWRASEIALFLSRRSWPGASLLTSRSGLVKGGGGLVYLALLMPFNAPVQPPLGLKGREGRRQQQNSLTFLVWLLSSSEVTQLLGISGMFVRMPTGFWSHGETRLLSPGALPSPPVGVLMLIKPPSSSPLSPPNVHSITLARRRH